MNRIFKLIILFCLISTNVFALNRVNLSTEYIPNPSKGKPISSGNIYVGVVDTDPEVVGNQKQISVLQENGTTVQVSQPIQTGAGGVPLYNGSPVTILVDGSYSLKVTDSSGAQVYYVPKNAELESLVSFDSIADLRAITETPTDGDTYTLLGYYTPGDGGGGQFYWDATSTDSDNNGTIIKVTSIATGRWKRLISDPLSIKIFGAKGDGITDDTTAIQATFTYANTNGIGEIYAPSGVYLTGTINWPGNNLSLIGEGSAYSYNSSATPKTEFLAKAGTIIVFDLVQTGLAEDRTGNLIQDIEVNGNSIAEIGITCAGSNIIKRCRIIGCTVAGLKFDNFTNSSRAITCGLNQNSGVGFLADGVSTTTYSVEDCNISLNTTGGMLIKTGVNVSFKNNVVESNSGYGIKFYRENTHTNYFTSFLLTNCWFEDNASTVGTFVMEFDAQTADAEYAPNKIEFNKCHFSVATTRKLAKFQVAKWVSFKECNFDVDISDATLITTTSNAKYISFINQDHSANFGPTGLTDAQIESVITTGANCFWHDGSSKRLVGVGSGASFENSWVNYGSGFTPAAYWYDSDGKVHIEGSVKTGSVGTTVFTLPAGYRPTTQLAFAVDASGSHGLVYITTGGAVQVNVGSSTITSLNGIVFTTE